jgi:copper(I)-binding protein
LIENRTVRRRVDELQTRGRVGLFLGHEGNAAPAAHVHPLLRTASMSRPLARSIAAAALTFALAFASDAVRGEGMFIVNQPWVRPAAAGRDTAAYMDLTSTAGARVVDAFSVAARSTRVLGRASASVDLPAGTLVALSPGAQRIALDGLLRTLRVHDRVPISLDVVYADGTRQTIFVDAEVRMHAPLEEEMQHSHGGPHSH